MLEELIEGGLVDYVAMDIKNSREKYPMTVGKADFDISWVERSAEILMRGKIPFEFRTTVVKELHTAKDIESVGRWLSGNEKFYLQTFKDSGSSLLKRQHKNIAILLIVKGIAIVNVREYINLTIRTIISFSSLYR